MTGSTTAILPARRSGAPVPPQARTGIRRDLQGLRGIAVLGVVIYHLRPSWLPGGFVGVDVFFVLSGYFITGQLLREAERTRRINLAAFWARRARRLLPASTLVLVITVLAGRLLTNPIEASRIARDGAFSAVFSMNWREAAAGIAYGQDPDPSPFQHYWSLGVEEQFYAFWPVVLLALVLAASAARRVTLRDGVMALSSALAIASFWLALRATTSDQPLAYYATTTRLWQLCLGGLLAAAAPRLSRLPAWTATPARLAGVTAIVGFYAVKPAGIAYPGWYALIPAGGAVLVVAAQGNYAGRYDSIGRLLSSDVGQLAGRYSYSWYLWHWPPLVLLPIYLGHQADVAQLLGCACGSLLLAVLTCHLVEEPVRRSGWLADRRPERPGSQPFEAPPLQARPPAVRGRRSLGLGVVLLAAAVSASLWTASNATTEAARTRITVEGQVLDPTPAHALAEQPLVSARHCQVAFTAHNLSPDCRYRPDTGHGDIVLVGDSHAGMWFPAVDDAARRNQWGLRVWARTSCPFADVRKAGPGGVAAYVDCYRWRTDVMSRLIAARPSLVIVTNFTGQQLHVTDPATHRAAPQARARQLLFAGMNRNLAALRAAGIAVLLIRDVPSFTMSGPDCALAHARDLQACSTPQSVALPYGTRDTQSVQRNPGVHLLDVTSVFCQNARCFQVVGHTLAYRDINHLTTEMARQLAPEVVGAIRAALPTH